MRRRIGLRLGAARWRALRSCAADMLAIKSALSISTAFEPPSDVRLGVLLPMFTTDKCGSGYCYSPWSPRVGVYQAVRELNNKSDGIADELLPNTTLRVAYRDSKCDAATGLLSAIELTRDAFNGSGVHAIVGAGCSDASKNAAQVAAGSRVPIVSPTSTSPSLSAGRSYPYFLCASLRLEPSNSRLAPNLRLTRSGPISAQAHDPLGRVRRRSHG